MPLCLKVLPEKWVVSVEHHEPYKTIASLRGILLIIVYLY